MKVAIVGSRSFNDYDNLKDFIKMICIQNNIEIDTIVSGGARGADKLGEQYAKENGYDLTVFPAEWDKYGKRAGFIRNEYIIDACDVCIAFWDGKSHGTKHDIELCKIKDKPCYIYKF
ncbi:MAG: GTP-binding domain protein [Wendovervirus sonii]|uniref:GTP-binding domain protein n=1 Tax=phage Lak_Megaphage_Sonny TaxID=3109229 RepID=A0ABZ0Z2T2_9CAUD|nr:MAG: GTP-binding domain protein [phage Lak_Megaphage_Sonny]